MTTSPQDDLTAERAAKIVGIIDGLAYIDPNDHRKCEEAIRPIIQQTRQEALIDVMRLHKEWRAGKHSGLFSDLLDRLASEGG